MIKTITSLDTLMDLAGKVGKAKQSGNKEELEQAQKEHDEYKELCLKSDEMLTGFTHGELC